MLRPLLGGEIQNLTTCFWGFASGCVTVRNGCRAGEVKLHDNNMSNPRNCSVIFLWLVPGNLVVGIERVVHV